MRTTSLDFNYVNGIDGMKKMFASLKPSFQFGSALTVISAIITDVLAPISTLGIWTAVGFFLVGNVLVVKAFLWPNLWRQSTNFMAELLNFPLAICFYIATAVTAYQFGIYQNPEFHNGYLSNKVALIDSLQKQIGISEEILLVQKELLDVQRQGVVRLEELKAGQDAQLSSQQEGVSRIVEVKDAVETLNLTLYGLSEAVKIGDLDYLQKWEASGRSLSNIYRKSMPVTPPILMEAIQVNTDNIIPILAFLEEKGELRTSELFDPEAPYVKNLSIIWANAIKNTSKIESAATDSTSYSELRDTSLSVYGIELSGVTEEEYLDFKAESGSRLDLYGNAQGGQVSLFTFARIVNNDNAIKFLRKFKPVVDKEYILMQGNMIRLDGKYLDLHR